MANATNFVKNVDYKTIGHEVAVVENNAIELQYAPLAGSVSIVGYDLEEAEGDTVSTGKYKIDGNKITFATGDFNNDTKLTVNYGYVLHATDEDTGDETVVVQEARFSNQTTAIGEAFAYYPVYASGDDCADSGIMGYWIVHIFRGQITTVPGMDTSLTLQAPYIEICM